ncbi:MAG: hypothetical protein ABI119_02510, partial [Gemmatimonadaceae bacterium]
MTPDSSSEPGQHLRLSSLPKTVRSRKGFSATAEWPARVLRQRRPVAVRRHAVRLIKRLLILGIADVSAVLVIQAVVWFLASTASLPSIGGLPTPFGPAPALVLLA